MGILIKWEKKPKWGIEWKVLGYLERERERETEELNQEEFYGYLTKWEKKPKWGIGWKVLSSLKRERERERERNRGTKPGEILWAFDQMGEKNPNGELSGSVKPRLGLLNVIHEIRERIAAREIVSGYGGTCGLPYKIR